MADNIDNSAAFATANMKPAAAGGENIDAVWGRNIADNTGFLYYRYVPVAQFSGIGFGDADAAVTATQYATQYFKKDAGMGTLYGSYVVHGSQTSGFRIRVNGVQQVALSSPSPGSGTTWKAGFSTDISALTNGNYYEITTEVSRNSGGVGHWSNMAGLTVWASA